MTSVTLSTSEYVGEFKPDWWVTPFLTGVLVGAGIMILIMTIVFGGRI